MLRWTERLNADDDIVDVLRFGRGAAIDSFDRSGYRPAWTTEQCALAAANRAPRVA